MNLTAIAHVCISCKDLEKTQEFYCDVLGLENVFDFVKGEKKAGFYLKISDRTFLEFFQDSNDYADNSPLRHLCLETKDIKLLRAHVIEKGIEATDISKGADQSFQFWVKDPNGVNIEFHEYTDESSQITGKPVEINW